MLSDVRIISHRTGELKRIIPPQQILGLKYSRVLRGVGVLVLTCAYNDALWSAYALDDFIEVYSGAPLAKEETYLLRGRTRYYENGTQQILFYGLSLNHLLARPLVVPTASDVATGGGFSTKAGNAVSVISSYISDQLIASSDPMRNIPLLTLDSVGTGNNVGARLRYDTLLASLESLALKGKVDYGISRTLGRNLSCYVGVIGSDKTYTNNYPLYPSVVFTPERGNLLNVEIEDDRRAEQNFAYVLGEGEGSNQFVYILAGDGIMDSLYNRSELRVNLRRGETTTSQTEQAITAGVAALDEKRPIREFIFDIPTNQTQGLVYGVDWVLGDRVTVSWGNERQDLRVFETEVVLAPNGEINRSVLMKDE